MKVEINDPHSWINNLSGWKEPEKIHVWRGLNLDLLVMTRHNTLSIKLIKPTGEQAIVRS